MTLKKTNTFTEYLIKYKKQALYLTPLGFNVTKRNTLFKRKHVKTLKNRVFKQKLDLEQINLFNAFNIKLKCYKSHRNLLGYPSRGQRTHTNARTKKKIKFKNII